MNENKNDILKWDRVWDDIAVHIRDLVSCNNNLRNNIDPDLPKRIVSHSGSKFFYNNLEEMIVHLELARKWAVVMGSPTTSISERIKYAAELNQLTYQMTQIEIEDGICNPMAFMEVEKLQQIYILSCEVFAFLGTLPEDFSKRGDCARIVHNVYYEIASQLHSFGQYLTTLQPEPFDYDLVNKRTLERLSIYLDADNDPKLDTGKEIV